MYILVYKLSLKYIKFKFKNKNYAMKLNMLRMKITNFLMYFNTAIKQVTPYYNIIFNLNTIW